MDRSNWHSSANLRTNQLFVTDCSWDDAIPEFVTSTFLHWLACNFAERKMRIPLACVNKQAIIIFIFLRRWKAVGENYRRHIVTKDIFDEEIIEKGKLINKIVFKSSSKQRWRFPTGRWRNLERLTERTSAYERALFTHKTRAVRNLFVDKNVLKMLVFQVAGVFFPICWQ